MFTLLKISFFCFFVSNIASAQRSYEIGVGLSRTDLLISGQEYFAFDASRSNGLYLYTAFNIERKGFDYQIKFDMIERNYLISFPGHSSYSDQVNENIYLQTSLIGSRSILELKGLHISPSIGMYSGYWIGKNIKGVIPNAFHTSYFVDDEDIIHMYSLTHYSYQNNFDNDIDNRIDVGVKFGVMATFFSNGEVCPKVSVYFAQSVMPDTKLYISKPKYLQNTLIISASITF